MFSFFNSLQKNPYYKYPQNYYFAIPPPATNPQDDVNAMSISLTRLSLLSAVSTLGDSWETR